MQLGLLWFDSDPAKGITAKATDAARRYQERFGVSPNTCYVNRAALVSGELVVTLPSSKDAVLRLLPAANIQPNHFWVGVESQ